MYVHYHYVVNKDEYNRNAFIWRRNAKYVDDVLSDERNAFQARAEDTGKARSHNK